MNEIDKMMELMWARMNNAEALLQESLNIFNELPNQKGDFGSTYDMASKIGKHLRETVG